MMPHILRRAVRSLWENLSLNIVATGVIAAAVLLLGVFLTVMVNLVSITAAWEHDVHISAYFHPDIPVERRFELLEQVGAMEGVEAVHYVSEQEAQEYLVSRMPEAAPVLEELGAGVLPSSLEITLGSEWAQPDAVGQMAEALAHPEFEDLDYGQQWVERFHAFLALLKLLGVIMGGLVGVAAIFLVANAIHLAVYSRRDELETMRLVGATDDAIIAPFLLEGLIQGLLGSAVALLGLWFVHIWMITRLQEALQLTLADHSFERLSMNLTLALVLVGCVLGVLGAWTAVRRFLARIP